MSRFDRMGLETELEYSQYGIRNGIGLGSVSGEFKYNNFRVFPGAMTRPVQLGVKARA